MLIQGTIAADGLSALLSIWFLNLIVAQSTVASPQLTLYRANTLRGGWELNGFVVFSHHGGYNQLGNSE